MFLPHTQENVVDVSTLKDLLQDLSSVRTDISVRLQMKGQSWSPHFASTLVFEKHAVLLVHIPTRTVINIPDLNEVQAFEINQGHKDFSAFREYAVRHPNPQKQEPHGPLYA